MEKTTEAKAHLLAEIERLKKELDSQAVSGCRLLETDGPLWASQDNRCAVVNSVQDAIYTIDLNGVILSLNPAFEIITGLNRAEWVGKTFGPLVHPDDLQRVAEHFAMAAAGEVAPMYEARFVTKSGEYKVGHFATAPHLQNGKVTAVVGVARDITHLKREEERRLSLERRIQEAQKLESLGVLAGGIAHDLNNLLMGILGNADLAMQGLSQGKPIQARLQDIKLTAIRLSELTNQMLAYSGRGSFTLEPADLTEKVREMSRLLEVSLSKKATLRFELSDDLPIIEADVSQLQQVIMNLLTNATESKGDNAVEVCLRTALFRPNREWLAEAMVGNNLREADYVLLEVSDTGFGMDQDTLKRVFDPFFTTKFTGRGLGLAAVLGIMRSHKGAIRVSSTPGVGSCFQILFPIASLFRATQAAESRAQDLSWNGQGKVLLVDDDPIVLGVAQQMLEEIGFDVIIAQDGVEAVETVSALKNELDLVLLDITMPRMDGIEALKKIRSIREDLKVVLSSGYNEQDACQRFSGAGIDGFLQKPYRFKSLVQIMRRIFSS